MIECKTFTFDSITAYAQAISVSGSIIDKWMDEVGKKTPFVEFELKSLYKNENGQVVLTYFAMKSDKINVYYEFRHLALQSVFLN